MPVNPTVLSTAQNLAPLIAAILTNTTSLFVLAITLYVNGKKDRAARVQDTQEKIKAKRDEIRFNALCAMQDALHKIQNRLVYKTLCGRLNNTPPIGDEDPATFRKKLRNTDLIEAVLAEGEHMNIMQSHMYRVHDISLYYLVAGLLKADVKLKDATTLDEASSAQTEISEKTRKLTERTSELLRTIYD